MPSSFIDQSLKDVFIIVSPQTTSMDIIIRTLHMKVSTLTYQLSFTLSHSPLIYTIFSLHQFKHCLHIHKTHVLLCLCHFKTTQDYYIIEFDSTLSDLPILYYRV